MNTTYVAGCYQVGVVTVAPSGSSNISPLLADNVFRNVSITIAPADSHVNNRYRARLYIDGELSEDHDYTDAGNRIVCHMDYNPKLFPPNVGVGTIPEFFHANNSKGDFNVGLGGFSLIIDNHEVQERSFIVYSTFEQFEVTKAKFISF